MKTRASRLARLSRLAQPVSRVPACSGRKLATMSSPQGTRPRWKTVLGIVVSIAIVVGIFGWAIPKFADYGA